MTDTERSDWLGVCNDQGVALEDFRLAFCNRCLQADCTRSQFGKSKFEQRASTWHERLFANPDTMPNEDPRFIQIRAKKFIEIPTGEIPELGQQSSWMDPRDLDDSPPAPQVISHEPQPQPEVELQPEPNPPPVKMDPQPTSPKPMQSHPQMMNTPSAGPAMIGGPKKDSTKKAQPVSDPWEAKPKPDAVGDGVQVVKPGARIRFDGSGV